MRTDPVDGAKVAVITGGTRGIGAPISPRLTARGSRVVAVYRGDNGSADRLAEELDGVQILQVDLADPEACVRVVGQVVAQHGRLDHLVNNAGVVLEARSVDTSMEDWNRIVAVALLFIVTDGHLAVIYALVQSFHAFPVGTDVLGWLRTLQPQAWGAEVFHLGLWIALPLVGMLLFVNLVLGVISRVAPQINVFAVGFPITLAVGLIGMLLTLPLMQSPFSMALERMLTQFR